MADNFELRKGMDVVDGQGAFVGTLDRLLSEDKSGATRFVVVHDRLVPVQAIDGVQKGRAMLGVSRGKLNEFPEHKGDEVPSPKEQQEAYGAMGLGPSGEAVEEGKEK